MESNPGKREQIYQILAGVIKSDSPRIDRSELGKIAKKQAPQFSPGGLGLVLFPVLLALSALGIAYVKPPFLSPLAIQIAPIVAAAATFVWFLICHSIRSAQVQGHAEDLSRAVSELENLRDYLRRFLQGMDQRTSRYFHAVTNTKVTTYFILMQIANAVEEKAAEIKGMLEAPSVAAVLSAFQALQGNLLFQDGAVLKQGETHVVPLARLPDVIPALIEHLETGVKELESEISSTRSLYQSTPEE